MCNGFGCQHRQVKIANAVTITSLEKAEEQPTQSRNSNDRAVSFAPQVTVLGPLLMPSSEMTHEEKCEIWWQQADFELFFTSAVTIACEIQKLDRASPGPASYTSVILETYSTCMDEGYFDEKLKSCLNRWVMLSHCRRGLERLSIPSLFRHKHRQQKLLVQGIVDMQHRLDGYLDPDQMTQLLYTYSEEQSRYVVFGV